MIEIQPLRVADLDPRVAPYTHIDHWDGHTIGVGDIESAPSVQVSRFMGAVATNELLRSIARPSRLALETFRPGDVFDAAAHPPGTLIEADDEILITSAAFTPLDPEDFANIPVPEPLSYYVEGGVSLGDGHFDYTNQTTVGIVLRTLFLRRPKLIRMRTMVIVHPDGTVAQSPVVEPRPSIINVGRVSHRRDSRDGREMLIRTNEVRTVERGQRTTARDRTIIPPGAVQTTTQG